MSNLKFWKTETIGNDFVLVHLDDVRQFDLSQLARDLCSRNFGIGSDGLLVVSPAAYGIDLRMFNPDGTEDFCGNGLRCAGNHARKEGWTEAEFEILHGGKHIPTSVSSEGSVMITLPPADFSPYAVPVEFNSEFLDQKVHGLTGTAVSTGSAHFVVPVEALPGDEEFFSISPRIETDPLFPEHISVMYSQEIARGHIKLRIWERSAGETMGCGTGSAAAAVVYSRKTGHTGKIVVSNPGGDLSIHLSDWRSSVVSQSNPVEVFHGEVAQTAIVTARRATLV